jgi:hypothetical protein
LSLFLVDRDDYFIKKSKKFFRKHPDLTDKFKLIILRLEKIILVDIGTHDEVYQ